MRGIEVLMRLSALSDSEHAQSCIDVDRRHVDIVRLEEWPWSSGERVLVDLVGAIYNGRPCEVYDLTALDDDNRRVAVMALGSWLVEHEAVYR
jgi:hypothetical protein